MSGLRKPAEIFGIAAVLASIVMSLAAWPPARAQQSPAVLFQNVRIFDGKSGALSPPSNVLVRNNKIEKISAAAITADAQVISGGGRVLMPGLIDAHWHAMLVRPTPASALASDVGYTNLLAAAEATSTLMRGFTTVRDMGGPAFALKRAIDEGLVAGPRIYPSGAIITVTSGHGDFRQPFEVPRVLGAPQSRGEQTGAAMIADSPDEVRVRSEFGAAKHGTEPLKRAILACERRGRPVEAECVIRTERTPERTYEFDVRAAPVTVEDTHFTVVSFRDVSAEKRREALEQIFFHDVLNTVAGLRGWFRPSWLAGSAKEWPL